MAQTPQEFFEKNMKWVALTFLILFLFKSIQSCNRNMGATMISKKNNHTIDSLSKEVYNLKSENKELKLQLNFQKEKVGEANKRAEAIQSVAEKIKSNTTTTVNVRGAQIDSTKKNK